MEGLARRFCSQPFRLVRPGVLEPPSTVEEAVAHSGEPVAPLLALGLPHVAEPYEWGSRLVAPSSEPGVAVMLVAGLAEASTYLCGTAPFELKTARTGINSRLRPKRLHPKLGLFF